MTEMKKVLIFGGKTGWIGQQMAELLKKEGASNVMTRLPMRSFEKNLDVGHGETNDSLTF